MIENSLDTSLQRNFDCVRFFIRGRKALVSYCWNFFFSSFRTDVTLLYGYISALFKTYLR